MECAKYLFWRNSSRTLWYPLTPGLLEEVAHNFKQLSQRKDLTLFVNANYESSLLMREYLINSLLFISRV